MADYTFNIDCCYNVMISLPVLFSCLLKLFEGITLSSFSSKCQHEVDSGFDQNLNVMSLASSRVSMLDSAALSFAETHAQSGLSKYNREDIQHNPTMHRSTSSISKGDMKFASTIRQLGLQDFHRWRPDRNGCADGHVGSSRTILYKNKSAANSSSGWLETEDAVGNF